MKKYNGTLFKHIEDNQDVFTTLYLNTLKTTKMYNGTLYLNTLKTT